MGGVFIRKMRLKNKKGGSMKSNVIAHTVTKSFPRYNIEILGDLHILDAFQGVDEKL